MVLELIAGDHVPVIPSIEVVGNGANGIPIHTEPIGEKVGTVKGFTIIVIVVVFTHCPAFGVNV